MSASQEWYQAIMDKDECKAVLRDLARYREWLSGTLDPAKLAGLEYVIRRLEAKLIAAGVPVLSETRTQVA